MPGLIGVERLTAIYIVFTLLLTGIYFPEMEGSTLVSVVGGRVAICIVTLLLYLLYQRNPCHATYQLRAVFQIALIAYWYPDIYNFAAQMPNMDHLIAPIDQAVFGYQPALQFSQTLSGIFWNELFNLGYFSYYLMIAGVILMVIFVRPRRFDRVTCIVLSTFFMYYLVFIFFNTAGPQFYFSNPDVDAANGIFPAVDDWFKNHNTLNHMSQVTGPFSYLIHMVQGSEEPIAAFPSSHVGASTIILILMFKLKKFWGYVMLPFYVILCLSTVYIGAHYAIDVLGGWISAFIFIIIANRLYKSKFIHRPDGFDDLHRFGHHRRQHKHRHHRH